ncbi:MAG TPA: NIF family HAD-type phosphatase [Pseudomonadota bacterium]|nr:NIF family HAD-type phosphatase [Pseudomonadota bacterium]
MTSPPRSPRLRPSPTVLAMLTLALGPVLWLACATAPPVTIATQPPTPAAAPKSAELSELDAYTLPLQPEWTDPYRHSDLKSDVRFFRIGKIMRDFSLSRFEAIEVQNHYRDLTAEGLDGPSAWRRSVAEVRAGHLGSGVDLAKLRQAPFIVVYDLDETLYQVGYSSGVRGPAWRDYGFDNRGKPSFAKLRSGWEQAIARVHALGGLVMLFTARSDDVAESAVKDWTLNGKNIRQVVDGFLTKSHLVMQAKEDGFPIITPSKDLRMFDESLERVIIVDDNPMRIVQHHRQRLVKKFQADPYLAARQAGATAKDSPLIASFDQTLLTVAAEVEESVGYMQQHPGTSFAGAYLPYTMLGQVAISALQGTGLRFEDSRKYIRDNPSYVDSAF